MPERERVPEEPCPIYFTETELMSRPNAWSAFPYRFRCYQYISSMAIRSMGLVEMWRKAGYYQEADPTRLNGLKRWNAKYLKEEYPVLPAVIGAYLLNKVWEGVKDPLLDHIKGRVTLAHDLHGQPFPGIRYLRPKPGPLSARFVIGGWYYALGHNEDDRVILVCITGTYKDNTKKPRITFRQILENPPSSKLMGYETRQLQSAYKETNYLHMRSYDNGCCQGCRQLNAAEHESFCVGFNGQYVTICAHCRVQAGDVCWE